MRTLERVIVSQANLPPGTRWSEVLHLKNQGQESVHIIGVLFYFALARVLFALFRWANPPWINP